MLKLNLVMVGSENPEPLVDFYTKVLGKPAWENGGYVGWQAGNATLASIVPNLVSMNRRGFSPTSLGGGGGLLGGLR